MFPRSESKDMTLPGFESSLQNLSLNNILCVENNKNKNWIGDNVLSNNIIRFFTIKFHYVYEMYRLKFSFVRILIAEKSYNIKLDHHGQIVYRQYH